jgi:hypothetical protein
MATDSNNRLSITGLIMVPAVITLLVTILRLYGELQGWSPRLFGTGAAGGSGAIIGISWLPILFGPYFALKLAGAGDGPASNGKAIGLSFAGFVVLVLGGFMLAKTFTVSPLLALLGMVVMIVGGFVARVGWHSLGNTLFAYAFAARIPVLIVMFIAMRAGWTTHYSAIDPRLASAPFWKQFVEEALLPQMLLWIGYTVVVGSIFGTVVAAVFARKPAAQPAT